MFFSLLRKIFVRIDQGDGLTSALSLDARPQEARQYGASSDPRVFLRTVIGGKIVFRTHHEPEDGIYLIAMTNRSPVQRTLLLFVHATAERLLLPITAMLPWWNASVVETRSRTPYPSIF